ncbi:MAG: flagellar hook-length control protein FliK [Pseudomonadota bacterium]
MDKSAGKSAKASSDSGEFSREFDKQVKSSREASAERRSENRSESRGEGRGESPSKPGDEAATREAKRAESDEARQGQAPKERTDEADKLRDGKTLPPHLAGGEGASAEGEAAPEEVNPLDALLRDMERAATDDEPSLEELSQQEESAQLPFTPLQQTTAEARKEAALEEGVGLSTSRLRDVLAQRMLAGQGGGEGDQTAKGRQGKAELNAMLTSQLGPTRSAGGFEQLLNSSGNSVGAMQPAVASQPAAASVPASMTLAVPVQQQGWGEAMGERVVWMARSNIQQAQIQLNPRDLGPVEIKIAMQNDQTNVNFVAHNATTREALEAALPRLRDMLGEQGLNLGQTNVSGQSAGDGGNQPGAAQDQAGQPGQGAGGGAAHGEEESGETPLRQVSHIGPGGVDYFA